MRRRLRVGPVAATGQAARMDMAPIPARRTLTEAESKQILAAAGLPVTREGLARSPAEAVRIAAEIGGPVALKIQSPDIPHKSDIGGVHLGAVTPAEVESAARQVLRECRAQLPARGHRWHPGAGDGRRRRRVHPRHDL